jgi:hypothetical protein
MHRQGEREFSRSEQPRGYREAFPEGTDSCANDRKNRMSQRTGTVPFKYRLNINPQERRPLFCSFTIQKPSHWHIFLLHILLPLGPKSHPPLKSIFSKSTTPEDDSNFSRLRPKRGVSTRCAPSHPQPCDTQESTGHTSKRCHESRTPTTLRWRLQQQPIQKHVLVGKTGCE